MNREQRRCDGHIVVKVTASRWTGETLLIEEFTGTPSVVAHRLRWLANHPRLRLPQSRKQGQRRAPPNYRDNRGLAGVQRLDAGRQKD